MPSPYTGNPTAVQSPDVAPGYNLAPIVNLPVDADLLNSASIYQLAKTLADHVAWIVQSNALGAAFGDGSDGSATLDGVASFASFSTRVGSVYTLTRDVFFVNLTVNVGVTLVTAGFRVFVKDTLTTIGGGSVNADGIAGTTGTSGAAAGGTGTLLSGGAGGGCGNNVNGTPGTNKTNTFGGAGGAGGNSLAGAKLGGAGGTATAPAAALGSVRIVGQPPGYIAGISGGVATLTALTGGGGGGGAGCDATAQAGAGGSGAGVLVVFARKLNLSTASDLHATGGAGGATGEVNCGGGGGGGGGVLILVYGSKNAVTFSAAVNCAGGAGGAKDGTGTVGTAGSNGTVFEMVWN